MLEIQHPQLVLPPADLPDLAPGILRQRLVVEGLVDTDIGRQDIIDYLTQLSEVCAMRVLQEPVTHRSTRYGWAGWVHWEASGAHFYAWERPVRFFSVDLYTCRAFDPGRVIDFTAEHFHTQRVVGRPFSVPPHALAADLIDGEGRSDPPFGLYVLRSDDPAAELARSVEREVFYEFFGNTPDLLEAEYGPYEGASLFLCVIDHLRQVPAGVIRMILPSPMGYKSLNDLVHAWDVSPDDDVAQRSGLDITNESVWDIATLAVQADYRGAASAGIVSLGLYQGLTMLAAGVDLAYAIAIFDLVVLDMAQTHFHRPWNGLSGLAPRRYLDSPSSLPVYCDVRDYRARLAMIDADMYELLFAGSGMEAVISSPLPGLDAQLDDRWFHTA